jgi:hypothetical protein
MQRDLAYADFAPLLNETFSVLIEGQQPIPVTLTEARPIKAIVRKDAFDLRFTGATPLPQHIHRLRHERLGTVQICLVPIGRTAEGYVFQALFQ